MQTDARHTSIPAPALWLGLAGVLPFWVTAAAQVWRLPGVEPGLAAFALASYGAVILSFLGGIRWGTALHRRPLSLRAIELATSVMPSLAGWAALLLPQILGLGLLIAGFLLQALWDVTSTERGLLPSWFGKLRMILTAGAVMALVAVLVRLLI